MIYDLTRHNGISGCGVVRNCGARRFPFDSINRNSDVDLGFGERGMSSSAGAAFVSAGKRSFLRSYMNKNMICCIVC